jgi:predicted dienelactone hydrolase
MRGANTLRILRALVAIGLIVGASYGLRAQVQVDTLTWMDSTRQRPVPVAFYHTGGPLTGRPVILFSHGYNANRPGSYLQYSYLAEALANAGWFVVSVQHELPTDEPLPLTGEARVVRMPSWERGAANLLFVLERLHAEYPRLDRAHVTVMGHSQGGDISMLFAQQHPDLLAKVLSLDNRRMQLPRTSTPQVCSIRSSDQPADDGVLPSEQEAADLHIRVVGSSVPHNNMADDSTPEQRRELIDLVMGLLHDPSTR